MELNYKHIGLFMCLAGGVVVIVPARVYTKRRVTPTCNIYVNTYIGII